jgi:DNA-binding CsgD family transcriptional regulator/tetratricopeptide (TPR) repeat protein
VAPTAGFVGRRVELAILSERFSEAARGRPQVVYLEGEAGSGKSTLISRFLGSLLDAVVLQAGGDEDESILSYGVVDQLDPDAVTDPGDDPMAVGARLLDLFDRLQADDRAVVLVLDDLQWADRPSLRAVLFALRRLRADKVLIVVSARSGALVDAGWARFVGGDSRVMRVRLGGLEAGDLTQLASALGLGQLSHRGARRLAAHTGGHALHCRALLDEMGVAALNENDEGLPAPRELSSVILARVAALSAATQVFMAAASVLGHHTSMATIASVAQLSDAGDEADEAVAAGMLEAAQIPTELRFPHPLYRAAIYDDLSPAVRRGLHARAAAVVVGGQRLAHRVAAAVGPDEQLASELESAAVADADLGELVAAAWAFERSAYLSPDAGLRERRLLDAASVQVIEADNAGAARTLAACRGSSARRDALSGLLGVYTGSADAENRLLVAWESHDPETESEIGTRAATSLANLMVLSGRSDQALMWADRAVDGTLRGSALHTRACVAQAFAMAAAGRSPDGLAALALIPESGNEVQAAATDALIMRGMLKLYIDDLAGAIADLGAAAARLRNGLPASYPGLCLADLSEAHFRRGDWDAAATYAQLATSLAMDTDRPVDLARANARAGQVLAFRGQWADAEAHARAARAAAERFPRALTTAAAAMSGASLAFAQGDWAGVIDAAEPVRAAGPPSVGGLPGMHNWRALEADSLVRLGRLGDAERALDEFDSAVPAGGLGSAVRALARCRGNLATAMGDETRAERAFAQAHSITTMAPMPFEVALLNLDDGRRLCRFRHGPAAVTRLEEAHKAFSHLGADPFVQACATELAHLHVTAAAQSPVAVLALSRAELAVARLVAKGLTNREAAAELFVSVKTVEYHLRHCYMKLDIPSRRALASLIG